VSPREAPRRAGRSPGGFTLIELLTVLAIIALLAVVGIGGIGRFRGASLAKAQDNAEALRQFLNLARVVATGLGNVIVVFSASGGYYYACQDTNADGDCSASEQAGLRLPQPDAVSNSGGETIKGVKLKYRVAFGTHAQAAAHVAQGRLSGTLSLSSEGFYYRAGGGGSIGNGVHLSGSPPRVLFNRAGQAQAGDGEIYLYLKKDDKNSFHFAVEVLPTGRVNLYWWALVQGSYKWRTI